MTRIGSKEDQDRAKGEPRDPKIALRKPKGGPRQPQEGPGGTKQGFLGLFLAKISYI